VEALEVISGGGSGRVVGPQHSLTGGQGALQEVPGGGQLALRLEQAGQVVEAVGGVGWSGPSTRSRMARVRSKVSLVAPYGASEVIHHLISGHTCSDDFFDAFRRRLDLMPALFAEDRLARHATAITPAQIATDRQINANSATFCTTPRLTITYDRWARLQSPDQVARESIRDHS